MPSEPLSLKELFLAALEIPPNERPQWLREACGNDADLLAQLERMLAAHRDPQTLLDHPDVADGVKERATAEYESSGSQADPAGSEHIGAAIGPYKLLQIIGEGGMGTVYMAQQTEPVRRFVALKIIKPGMDSRQVIARFEAERQALALMDHPNIARVFDGGAIPALHAPRDLPSASTAGRPYFVMELVRGVPITKYCDEHRLTPRERLELFIPVCHAIQHAHQKGIIHRDVKPSNVLVAQYDGKPIPKVIDFGIAKATGQQLTELTLVTGFGAVVGTLEYMSPEQAELNQLDIDTRSDIYSLGVLLYELLTGTTPLERKRLKQAAILEVLRLIREEEPPRPSTRLSTVDTLPSIAAKRGTEPKKLTGAVRGELDWIVMKALEKDRNRRYETASGFGQEIQRYLNDEPVQACPPSVGYRLKKFVRRNKVILAAAALVAAAFAAGAGVAIWQAIRATEAQAVAEAEAEAKELARAEESLQRQLAQAREAETKAVLGFVENKVFAAARPKDQEGGLGFDVKLADAVKAALPYVGESFPGQPLIEARLRMTMGLSFWYLGKHETAVQQMDAARQLYAAQLGSDDPETLQTMMGLANCYRDAGRYEDALKLREETYRLSKARLGPEHLDTLKNMNNLANSYTDFGRTQEALQMNEEALPLMRANLGADHPVTIRSMQNLANCYADTGRVQDALRLRQEVLPLSKNRFGPEHPETINNMNNLANSYSDNGQIADALKLHRDAFQLALKKLGSDHLRTLEFMNNLANSYAAAGENQEALKLRVETFRLRKIKLGIDHPQTLTSMGNLAESYRVLGRAQESVKLLEETVRLSKLKLGPNHPDTLWTMNSLAKSYRAAGQVPEAIKLHKETLQLQKEHLAANHPDTLSTMKDLVVSYSVARQYEVALKLNEELLTAQAAVLGPKHRDTVSSLYNQACLHSLMISRSQEKEKEAVLAVAWLKKAAAAGYNDLAQLNKDEDLNALRSREDFKKLVLELAAADTSVHSHEKN